MFTEFAGLVVDERTDRPYYFFRHIKGRCHSNQFLLAQPQNYFRHTISPKGHEIGSYYGRQKEVECDLPNDTIFNYLNYQTPITSIYLIDLRQIFRIGSPIGLTGAGDCC